MKIDLIERLGGYEKAKEILSNCPQYYHEYQPKSAGIYESGYYRDSAQNRISMVSLKKALLQYRREHDIFEVGDSVVIKNKPHSSNRLHVILRVDSSGYFIAPVHGDLTMHMLGCMASDFYLRHATPEEIEAGRRLEVCGG